MADYVSILNKAVSGLADNSEGNRQLVYQKARAAIERKLRAMDPVPSETAIANQLSQLENAIGEVETDFTLRGSISELEVEIAPEVAEPAVSNAPKVEEVEAVAAPSAPIEAAPTPPSAPIAQTNLIAPANPPAGFIDDVILIDGIGEKTSSLLKEEGITGISQIAAMDDGQLAAITEKIGFPGFEVTQEWKIQAQSMLAGTLPRGKTDQDRLSKLRAERELVVAAPVEEPVAPAPVASPIPAPAATPADVSTPVEGPLTANVSQGEASIEQAAPDSILHAPVSPEPVAPSSVEPARVEPPVVPEIPVQAPEASIAPPPTTPVFEEPVRHDPAPVDAPVAPPSVGQLDNDPFASAGDPHLERHDNDQRIIPPKKKGAGGKILGATLGLSLLGAAAAGAYYYREPLMVAGQRGMETVKKLIAPIMDKPAEQPMTSEEPKAEPVEQSGETKDDSRLGSDSDAPTQIAPESETPSVPREIITEPATPVEPEQAPEAQVEDETPVVVPENNELVVDPQPETQVETPTTQEQSATETTTEDQTVQPVAVLNGEKAFLYEEALGATGASRDEGAITWTLGNEPPEAGAPPEAVIKGAMEIPSRGLTMNITIKRNIDAGLPASHIIELIFKAPAGFSGGNIDGVSRFVMKATEQARGESLVGVPARIDAGYFLIALNNLQQAQATNLNLLENSDWIDIPVSYVTGRRALMTFEKGSTGSEVFSKALADWKNR